MPSWERIPARTRQVVTTLLARVLLFLLADGGPPSSFAGELIDGEYDVTVFGRRPEADVTCPVCVEGGSRPARRENARDRSVFYGCSNWPLFEHRQRASQGCGTALPVRADGGFSCRDCGESIQACSVCDGWLETRMGRYGRFPGYANPSLRPAPSVGGVCAATCDRLHRAARRRDILQQCPGARNLGAQCMHPSAQPRVGGVDEHRRPIRNCIHQFHDAVVRAAPERHAQYGSR